MDDDIGLANFWKPAAIFVIELCRFTFYSFFFHLYFFREVGVVFIELVGTTTAARK